MYDRDDARWRSDREFVAALAALGRDRSARAVVIRTGATSAARRRTARLVRATHVYVVLGSDHAHRINRRRRADAARTVAGVRTWFARFDRADHVQQFPGWEHVELPAAPAPPTSEPW
ncbi:hypothetical protein [Cellulomonas oligotrophica]|uniref:Uncharacterized protein n=1 Tax=Cellulomonas oligotrophica TaxID=931536 RepID=A0A7Y9FJ16_9CELL|nr:hypothetical protein [Cellulomonas oligotrophica]NYD87787.1 hypothetical protein [Cellulomonas oligotrophica]